MEEGSVPWILFADKYKYWRPVNKPNSCGKVPTRLLSACEFSDDFSYLSRSGHRSKVQCILLRTYWSALKVLSTHQKSLQGSELVFVHLLVHELPPVAEYKASKAAFWALGVWPQATATNRDTIKTVVIVCRFFISFLARLLVGPRCSVT